MAVRDGLRRDAAQYLEEGEQVQAVFYAKQPTMEYNDRAVVATDRRLLLLELNFFGRARGLVGEVPRETRLGPCSGTWWTDNGSARQRRELKHGPRGETRLVPLHPELVVLLTQHLKKYPPGPTGRIFTGPSGGIFNDRAYLKIFHKARTAAFTRNEAASLLARRPYDLRHTALSTWLNAGVPAPQVAKWAGHSVSVLLRVYTKCISGQQDEAKRRIQEATQPREDQ